MRHSSARSFLTAVVAASFLTIPVTGWTAPEELEVSFDLAQYSHNAEFSFSRGCISSPPTGRNNYVHITVVWLEDDAGNYVTTLYRWGRTFVYNLKAWALASNMAIDGITSATPTSNANRPAEVFKNFSTGRHDISWLPDGNYRIRIESTQCELADEYRSGTTPLYGPETTFMFTKGRTAQSSVMLGSDAPFNNVTIDYRVPTQNAPPGAFAGPDIRLMPADNPSESTTTLTGRVDDDSGDTPTVQWSQVASRPAGLSAQIASPAAATTAVAFNTAGIYTFRLTATDAGGESSSDEINVWVNAYTLDVTHDAEVARGQRNVAMGIIENSGPWLFSWGQCNAGENYSRGYMRFDVSGAGAAITSARLRMPWGEGSPVTSNFHDYYLLTDAQDDWNTSAGSTDWEASLTFNNQSVPEGLAANLDPTQQIGTFQHVACLWRHAFTNPDPPAGPGADCPPWVDVDLDLGTVSTHDQNGAWSIFVAPRQGCNNGLGIGSKENLINPHLELVEFWQSEANQAPVADAGPDRVITDQRPTGTELVKLDASGSSDDGGIVTYAWAESGQSLGTSAVADGVTVPLTLGAHDLELTVTDGAGLTGTDRALVTIDDRYHPNHSETEAAAIDGRPDGKTHDDLFGDGEDWFVLDLVDGSDLDVTTIAAGGDLDLELRRADGTSIMQSTPGGLTDTVSAQGLTAGRYFVVVTAAPAGATPYGMTVTVGGPTLIVELAPASAVESAGTLTGAGTVRVADPAAAAITVDLTSELPSHLSFGTNPVTIAAGSTSVAFDIVLVDDPAGAPDENRFANIRASAANFNGGSALFEILDDEATLVVSWAKATESTTETGSPLVVLTAILSGTPSSPVTVPYTLSGTAQEGEDYEIVSTRGTVTFTDTAQETVLISIIDDALAEENETIVVTMGQPTGANAGAIATHTLTIENDDGPVSVDPGDNVDGGVDESGCACAATERPQTSAAWGLAMLFAFVLRVSRRRSEGTDSR